MNSILKEFDSKTQMFVRMISSFGFRNEDEKNNEKTTSFACNELSNLSTECDNLVGQQNRIAQFFGIVSIDSHPWFPFSIQQNQKLVYNHLCLRLTVQNGHQNEHTEKQTIPLNRRCYWWEVTAEKLLRSIQSILNAKYCKRKDEPTTNTLMNTFIAW